jgi:transposase-like protein
MAKRERDAVKERRWRDLVKRHVGGGLSVREFCRREQLTESAFYAWRRTITERDKARGGRRQEPAFVPAVVTEEPPREASIAIELADGSVLRFSGSTSTEQLADLVVALQSRCGR